MAKRKIPGTRKLGTRKLTPKESQVMRDRMAKRQIRGQVRKSAWAEADVSTHTPNPGAKGNYSRAGGSSGSSRRLPTKGQRTARNSSRRV